jgi:hypothetical protein
MTSLMQILPLMRHASSVCEEFGPVSDLCGEFSRDELATAGHAQLHLGIDG